MDFRTTWQISKVFNIIKELLDILPQTTFSSCECISVIALKEIVELWHKHKCLHDLKCSSSKDHDFILLLILKLPFSVCLILKNASSYQRSCSKDDAYIIYLFIIANN